MQQFQDTEISRAILAAHHEKLSDRIDSDVIIAGAGPAGMTAAYYLSRAGYKVSLMDKKLAPGGGIWGGGMTMNDVVIQNEALPILDEFGIRHREGYAGLHTVDAMELASALCLKAIQAGTVFFNLATVEDVCVHGDRVTGVVVNRTGISGVYHVDPIMFSSRAVLDGTGHDAELVQYLRKRNLVTDSKIGERFGEGPMDAFSGEAFVVENVCEVYPGLWIAGMSVCAVLGGPRMGPIFGGMLLSGKRVAEEIVASLEGAGK